MDSSPVTTTNSVLASTDAALRWRYKNFTSEARTTSEQLNPRDILELQRSAEPEAVRNRFPIAYEHGRTTNL